LELLEQRVVLDGTAFVVSSLADTVADDGFPTLREAIQAANTDAAVNEAPAGNGADTITFAAHLFASGPQTLTLAGSELAITDDLAITGPGRDLFTVDAAGNSRVFHIASDVTAALTDLAITGGVGDEGGGIYTVGTLTISNAAIHGNSADYFGGGGVFIESGELVITNTAIFDNSTASYGGAICNRSGIVTLTGDTFFGNSARERGGAIYNGDAGTVLITDTTILRNLARSDGGGISNSGVLSLADVAIRDNSAGSDGGGGILNFAGTLTITDTTISGNSAGSRGGGIMNFVLADMTTLTNVTISHNVADSVGGGILNAGSLKVTGSTISGNFAGREGGGIRNSGTVTATNTTISGNSAGWDGYSGTGGGIYNHGDTLRPRTVMLDSTTIFGNSAGRGGGIYSVYHGIVTLHNTIVADNSPGNTTYPYYNDVRGVFDATSSHNLVGIIDGSTNLDSDPNTLYGTVDSPLVSMLDVLADYGGPTFTHALLPGSPALDAGSNELAVAAGLIQDQRSLDRFVDANDDGIATVDIGAYEQQVDFGDAPSPYPTTLGEDGARHVAVGPSLGPNRDSEADGSHSAAADADDTTGTPDDEDGATFGGPIMVGQLDANVTVNVQHAPTGAKLDVWIDFNADGSWGGPSSKSPIASQ